TRRMRKAGRVARTVILRLRFADFSRATRSQTMPCASAQSGVILATARALLLTAMPMLEPRGLTLLGVSVTTLDDGTDQLALHAQRDPGLAIDEAVDEVRRRYGTAAVTRAVLLGRRPGFSVPLLPD